MNQARFVYTIYILSTPEHLWNALLDSELTSQYWGRHRNVSDWKVGSTWKHQDYDDDRLIDIVGKVIENTPPRRLVLTWALPEDAANEAKHSRVTFEVEPFFDAVRLTLIHDRLQPESEMWHGVSRGWPAVLSSLKTLLETGHAMPMTTRRWSGPLR